MKKSLGAKTLAYPTPVWLVGTYDQEGRPNIMTAAWAAICCSKPPCVAVSLRKATYSYGNIVARQAFTISIPAETHVKEADYVGTASIPWKSDSTPSLSGRSWTSRPTRRSWGTRDCPTSRRSSPWSSGPKSAPTMASAATWDRPLRWGRICKTVSSQQLAVRL
jgi:hypothetical protein